MIHYITCHFGSPELIDMQLQHIEKFTNTNYKVWMSYTTFTSDELKRMRQGEEFLETMSEGCIDNHKDVISRYKDKCHYFEYIPVLLPEDASSLPIRDFSWGMYVASQNHQNNLHIVTERVLSSTDIHETDMIVWLDSDAFLVDNVDNLFVNGKDTFTAIQRNHMKIRNNELLHPHPSFACCSVAFFKKHWPNIHWMGAMRTAWCFDQQRVNKIMDGSHVNNVEYYRLDIPHEELKQKFNDTGGSLYYYFQDKGIDWITLNKTGRLGDSNKFFEIYDNKILHITFAQQSLLKSNPMQKGLHNNMQIYDDILNGKYLSGI